MNGDSLCRQFNFSVILGDVSIDVSSHPQGKSEARCESVGIFIGMAPALTCPCDSTQRLWARLA